jgi:mono/diheme cytochrome c family protein
LEGLGVLFGGSLELYSELDSELKSESGIGTSTVLSPWRCVLKKRTLIGLSSLLFAFMLWAQEPKDQPPAEYKIPPEASAKQNPVKPTAESHARGKKLYGYDCEMCHGKNGDGKGDMASDYKNGVTDFTKPESLKNRSDGDLFYIIRNGKGQDMPPEGDRAKDDDIWHLVNYIRSFAKK